ncbi:hypothetical protein [Pseudoalteromonas sp. S16_S37]|uniref:hypothetical protein n=1 Tax=Pseudoalteromonas sp. S16_S37 TaxID=2720228 RepID=UPI0016814B93|nr:hypothetical protein [Pseudoalteromonas sp. S16_S37]MBD1582970.1 hypothetical protein [Pseudoalteromonas sp. S16_S37]
MRVNLKGLLLAACAFVSSVKAANDYAAILEVLKRLDDKLVESQLAPSLQSTSHSIPEGEMLFLSLYLDSNYLGEVIAIKSKSGAWLELNGFFDSLDFAIQRSARGYEGWFIDADNKFTFDENSLTAKIAEQTVTIKAQELYKDQDDIYIDMAVLAAWFDLDLSADYGAQDVTVSSKHVLPIEAKLDRARRSKKQLVANKYATKPWKASPYRLLSSPLMDVQLGYQKSDLREGVNYSVLGAHDFAYMRSEYFFSGQQGNLLNQSRLTFSRDDEQAQLFGALQASEFKIGDVIATRVGGLHQNQLARGIKLSNAPLDTLLDQNRISITGEVQNGWDVELYQNGVLVEQKFDSSDGRYLFENINLLVGLNEFEIILYGPQGQVEKRTQQYFIDGSALESGQGVYEVSITQQGHRVFDDKQYQIGSLGWLLSTRYEQGLSDTLSLYGATSVREGIAEGPKNTISVGSNMTLANRFLVNVSYERDDFSQSRLELVTRAKLLHQAMRLHYKRLTKSTSANFVDKNTTTQANLGLELSGNITSRDYGRLNYRNTLSYTQQQNQTSTKTFTNSLNYMFDRYALGNQLSWNQLSDGRHTSLGSAQMQARFGKVYSRLSVNYTLKPERDITSYSAEFYTNLLADLQAQFTYTSSLDNDLDTTKLTLGWQTDDFSVNTSMSYNSDDHWQLGFFGRFSIGYNVMDNSYFTSRRSLTQSGSTLVRVFLDHNNNGRLDEGEALVENLRVKAVQAHRHGLTNTQGIAELTGMLANRKTDIELDEQSINDPFFVPRDAGVSITPRAGFVEYVDFPLVNASEVEGSLYAQRGKVLPYTKVNLLDADGKLVAQTESAFDGYYLFTGLKPGQYVAQVEEKQLEQKNLKVTQEVMVELPNEGSVLSGVDLSLKEKDKFNGSFASLGEFSSLSILKTYFVLINKRLKSMPGYSPFYFKESNSDKYILAASYSAQPSKVVNTVCELVKQRELKCEVKQALIRY